jgi:hypothetical protein
MNSREKDPDVLEVLQQLLEQMHLVFQQNEESSCQVGEKAL